MGPMNPGCNCCAITCTQCTGGVGPAAFQVVITGFTNDACGTCNSLNATWIIPFRVESFTCNYRLQVNSEITCGTGNKFIQVDIGSLAGQIDVNISWQFNGAGNFEAYSGSALTPDANCRTWSGISVTLANTGTPAPRDCGGASLTAVVTAL